MKPALLTTAFILASLVGMAQLRVNKAGTKMTIDGSSNAHDWTEKVETINGTCNASFEGTTLTGITSLDVTIPVRSIKSEHNTMDKNTYNAMDADKYPNIVFKLKSASISGKNVVLAGTLTIHGKTQNVSITCAYTTNGHNLTLTGQHKMKMTQYGIDPPTAMLGAMKTYDDLLIKFTLAFN